MCSSPANCRCSHSPFAILPNNVQPAARGGSRNATSIFNLHAQVLADYRDFVRSFFIVADERAQQFVEHALDAEARLWPDFLLQVSPAYARAATGDELAAQSMLHEQTARIFRTPEGSPFHLYHTRSRHLTKRAARKATSSPVVQAQAKA